MVSPREKLLELKDVKEWVKWLRSIYEKNEKEVREAVQREMQRQQPPEKERLDPKWRINLEVSSPSHSIRENKLIQFNKGSDWIKLKRKEKDTAGEGQGANEVKRGLDQVIEGYGRQVSEIGISSQELLQTFLFA